MKTIIASALLATVALTGAASAQIGSGTAAAIAHFNQDAEKYIECVAGQMSKEEDNYNKCTAEVLTRLKITREQFIKTEQTLMMDPLAQMEMLEKGMESDNEYEGIDIPSDLT